MTVQHYTKDEVLKVFEDAHGMLDPEFEALPEHEKQETLENFGGFMVQVNTWLRNGEGVCVYENKHIPPGAYPLWRFFSYGTDNSTFDLKHCPRCSGELFEELHCGNSACSGHDGVTAEEASLPPTRLPDFPTEINWRYQLVGVYRGEPLS